MKIYTKKGDEGKTSLLNGQRVYKNDEIIELYGNVDELNVHIGWVSSIIENPDIEKFLRALQHTVFEMGTQIIGSKRTIETPHLDKGFLEKIESKIDEMEKVLPELKNFVLPGGNTVSSACHLSRCICRKVERKMVALNHDPLFWNIMLKIINRMSDYFFVLARFVIHKGGKKEYIWKPAK